MVFVCCQVVLVNRQTKRLPGASAQVNMSYLVHCMFFETLADYNPGLYAICGLVGFTKLVTIFFKNNDQFSVIMVFCITFNPCAYAICEASYRL